MGMVLMVLVVFMMDIEAIIMAKSRMGWRRNSGEGEPRAWAT